MPALPASGRWEMASIAGGARFAARPGELAQDLVEGEVCVAAASTIRGG